MKKLLARLKKTGKISFGEFASCVKGYGWQTLFAPIFVVCEVFLEVFIPRVMTLLIDEGVSVGNTDAVLKYGGLMLALALLALVAGALSARLAAVATMGFARNLRKKLFDKIQDFSFGNIDKFSTGSLITRLTTDVNFIRNAFMMLIRVGFRAPVMFAMSIALALDINTRLAMIFVAVAPVMAIAMFAIGAIAFPLFGKMFRKFDAMNARLQENLIGIRVVKAFVRENHETEAFRKAAEDVRNTQVKAEKLIVYGQPFMQFAMYGCMVAVVWFGGNMIIKSVDGMTIGGLNAFISYINQILMSLLMVAMIFVNLVISSASLARCSEVLRELPEITDETASPDLEVADGSVVFENVSFGYGKDPAKEILSGINLEIPSGSVLGIIGGTGSAKTTLVQLIPRLYDVTSGSVRVGGEDVRNYKIRTLRDSVAMVLQQNVLFSGTIRDNLRWGNDDATDEEIEEAAKNAEAHKFVSSFSEGYDTDLGQGGVNVSGGQKQRLCIARAMLKKPKIMILDDSTSAVDTATDAAIRKAFAETLKGMTVIIIAQRISSVKHADKIIVMEDGKIAASGTHEELYANSPVYREVCDSQAGGVKDE